MLLVKRRDKYRLWESGVVYCETIKTINVVRSYWGGRARNIYCKYAQTFFYLDGRSVALAITLRMCERALFRQ